MDIRLFVTEKGQIALTCHDGAFREPVEAIELDYTTTMLSIRLRNIEEPISLNCPVYHGALEHMLGQEICTIGFYLQGQLAGAMFVPFDIVNMPRYGRGRRKLQ